MGVVLKVKDLTLDPEIVALKVLYPRFAANSTTLARFRREVSLTRRLSHPNIARIFDLGLTQDTDTGETLHYLAMEYVKGENLEAKIKAAQPHGLSFDDIPRILHEVAAGLGYAHKNGIVHRDIKPANILIASNNQIKITDFGVARVLDSAEQLTRTNEAIGSPNYMSPEQITAERLDNRADLYSLGIVAFELATGSLPYKGEQWMELVQKHISEDVPQIRAVAPQVEAPVWFQGFVEMMCAKDRSKRFQTGEQIAGFLELNAGVTGRMATQMNARLGIGASGRFANYSANHKFIAPTAVMLVVALVGAGGYVVVNHLLSSLTP